MTAHRKRFFLFFSLAVFLFCGKESFAALRENPVNIVASFSILGDMIRQVGGDRVNVTLLVGPDQDAHTYQPSPQDAVKLSRAEIIAINGLKFEGWMGRLIKASGKSDAKLLVASAGVKPRLMEEARGHELHEGESAVDPHAWQDLGNARIYVQNIAAALIEARPADKPYFMERARAYYAEIKKLDAETREAFAAIPRDKRKVITGHDAFGYFSDAYGVTFVSPQGVSTETEPSASTVAALIEHIKKNGFSSLFVENMASSRLVEQMARDTETRLGGTLYTDSLSRPEGPAGTYLDLFRHNAKIILDSMRR